MKTIAILFFLSAILPLSAQITIRVEPDPVRVGERAEIILTSEKSLSGNPDLPRIRNLEWNGISQSSYQCSLNGGMSVSRSVKLSISFLVTKEGSYTIPAFRVGKYETKPLTFKAVKSTLQTSSPDASSAGEEISMDDALFAELRLPEPRKKCYAGEELPLDLNVYIVNGVRLSGLSYPTISFGEKGGAVFHDYGKINPENPNFAPARQSSIRKDGRNFRVVSFRTRFRPIAAGTLKIESRTRCQIMIPDRRRRSHFDDMFDSFFDDGFMTMGRPMEKILETRPVTLEVQALPPVPQGGFFSGLTGKWEVKYSVSKGPYRAGEPVTFQIDLHGDGSTDMLQVPKLELEGFRIYPAEVEKNPSGAIVRYVMIPTEPYSGEKDNLLFEKFLTFYPDSGTYQTTSFRRNLKVEKGNALLPQNQKHVTVSAAEPETEEQAEEVKHQQEDVLYLKKDRDSVSSGIFRNQILSLIFPVCGVLFVLIAWLFREHRKTVGSDPAFRRRNEAKHSRKQLFRDLKAGTPEDLAGKHAGDIASYLAGAWSLAPGADLSECASEAEKHSPELAEMLKKLAAAAWLPSKQGLFDETFRKKFIRLLGKVLLFTLLVSGAFLEAAQKKGCSTWADAMRAYDQEKFGEAEQFFSSESKDSAHALYNAGNCFYRMGKLPDALVRYERALKLAPGDTDILENLNLVRRKLSLPEKYRIQSPSDAFAYWLDALRPDEWLTVFCFGIFLLLTALGLVLLNGNRLCIRILTGFGIMIFLISGIAQIVHYSADSGGTRAIIMARNPVVYASPSLKSAKAELHLRSGEEITIAEQRTDWLRIRSGSAEGWLPSKDAERY